MLMLYNKIDLCQDDGSELLPANHEDALVMSAYNAEDLLRLRQTIQDRTDGRHAHIYSAGGAGRSNCACVSHRRSNFAGCRWRFYAPYGAAEQTGL